MLILVASVFLISVAIAAFTSTWDPLSFIGGIILLPFAAVLGLQQYRATFRVNARAASISAVLLFIVGGFVLFAFATTLGEMLLESDRLPWLSLLIPMLTVGFVSSLAGWLNVRWSRQLKTFHPSTPPTVAAARFSWRELLAAVAVVACVTAIVMYLVQSTPPPYAENVSRDLAPFGLPAGCAEYPSAKVSEEPLPTNSP